MFGGMTTAPSKNDTAKEDVVVTNDVRGKIENIEGVISVEPIFTINNVDIYLDGDTTPYPLKIIGGSDLQGNDKMYNGFFGEDDILNDGEIFVSDYVVSFFETTNEEILGREIVVKSSSSGSFLSVASKSMIDKEFHFVISGVTNSGNDAFFVNNKEALDILVGFRWILLILRIIYDTWDIVSY